MKKSQETRKRPLARLIAEQDDEILASITGGCTSTNTCSTTGPDEDERILAGVSVS